LGIASGLGAMLVKYAHSTRDRHGIVAPSGVCHSASVIEAIG
jgi:hypothetical protein